MKVKYILILLILFNSAISVAQRANEDPDNWSTSNAYSIAMGAGITVSKSLNFQSGTYAVQLESKYSNALGKSIPGMLSTGTIQGLLVSGGQSYTTRSVKLTGYYQYAPTGTDLASMEVLFSKWNTASGKRDTIAYGIAKKASSTTYTPFEVILIYKDKVSVPDSQLVILSSSVNRTNPPNGSVLLLDNLSFSNSTSGLAPECIRQAAELFPNPVVGHFTLRSPYDIKVLKICNLMGEEMLTKSFIPGEKELDIQVGFAAGIYMIYCQNHSGNTEVLKFVKVN
jgi:hypothetical protein